jgi:hypothetical protein
MDGRSWPASCTEIAAETSRVIGVRFAQGEMARAFCCIDAKGPGCPGRGAGR